LEFEPLLASQLDRTARTTLAIEAALLAMLVVLGFVGLSLLRSRDRLMRRAEHDRRLTALGEMAAVVAHEIRNPLASLKGHAQLLAESFPDASPERAKIDRVVKQAKRLEAVTSDLLTFVRSGTISRAPVDPVALMREVAETVGGQRVEIRASDAPASWSLDAARLRQALSNVIENAIHAAPPDTSIEATVGRDGPRLCFVIRDRGPGIAVGDEERIFEPFFTCNAQGSGIGLAVARHIVALHGGAIRARNHAEGGATFSITIPEA
jgi:two-component system sensor histidine kinase HydH